MKALRTIGLAALALASVLLAASCGGGAGGSAATSTAAAAGVQEVNVYNWAVYLPDEVKAKFTAETGIKLNYKEYNTNEEMFTTLQSGDSSWDIVFPSQDYVPVLAEKGMAEEIDKSKIPNFANIDQAVLDTTKQFDPDNKYSVPYNIGTTGIIYWKDKVKVAEADQSWALLARPDLKGHTTLLDDMRETMGAALRFKGYSLNTDKQSEIDDAVKVVNAWKANALKAFDADGLGKNFASKNYWAVFAYPENTMSELDDAAKKDVGFFLPKEGGPKYLDSMVILKSAKNKENAYKFIDFILRPDVLAAIDDAYGYPGISSKANALRKTKPLYTLDQLKSRDLKLNVGAALDLYSKAWQEQIKIGQ